jgi:hypothetical protein
MSDHPDKRDLPRIPVDSAVVYSQSGSTTIHHGRARNLSGSGILFTTPHRPEPGCLLNLHMRASPGRIPSLKAIVEVVRITPATAREHFQVAGRIREVPG